MKGRENKCTRVLSIHTAIVSGVSELGESCDASAATELLQQNSMSKDKLARLGWRRPLKAHRRQPDSIELCTRVLLRTELCVLEQQNVSVTNRATI